MQAPEPSPGNRKWEILRQALKRTTPLERAAFLDGACAGDAALRVQIDALLAIYEEAERDPALNAEAAKVPRGAGATEITPTLLDQIPLTEGPGTVIARYKLLEQIGEGGFGVVYVAEQQEPVHREVALKVIKLGMDTRQVVARFEAERQALALMDHPNIAKVFDAGATDSGRPYFVMELVKGMPITKYCDQEKLSTIDRLNLFIAVCQAIQHAHQKGIIHRDIKPSNIMVTVQEGKPAPKVIDFGIAKATQQKLTEKTLHTQLEQFIGTPAYMSPEQAEMSGLDIDTRSDIYSLGVLLYELLTGTTPFDANELLKSGLDGMRKIIRENEPPRPSTKLSTMLEAERTTTAKHRALEAPKLISLLRGDLDWIVMKCLEKDRTRRYETVNGLARDIERHLDNEPVVARPPSATYRLQKAWRRNKLVFTAATVVVAALVVGIGVSSWQAIEASRARNAERQQKLAAQTERDKARVAQKVAEKAQQAENQQRERAEKREAEASHLLYVANMNLAQQAWEQNNVGRVRQLLDDTATSPERGFEWYYWQRQTHLEIKALRGHLGEVSSVAFSPDGRRIVTGSYDGTAKVWEADSGKELLTLKGHMGAVRSVAFSPDGQRIVTASEDETAKLWEAAKGHDPLTLKGHTSWLTAVAFSADGYRIVTGSGDKTAKVWEAASGRELLTLRGHNGWIESVAFSPDGQRIVTGSYDETAKVWEARSGRPLLALKGHSAGIWSVAFSPDGQRVVTGSGDQTAKVWEAESGTDLLTLKGHTSAITSVAFSADGYRIVTGGGDQTAKVWEVVSGLELFTLKGHNGPLRSVAFSPDGQRILTGSLDQTAKVWDAADDRQLLRLKGHSDAVTSVAFSPDGQRIATGSDDGTVKVWEAGNDRELLPLKGHTGPVKSVAFSPDGRRVVTGSWDQTAKVWEAASGLELFTLKGHNGPLRSVAFSPDGQRILTGSNDQTAKVWDAASGKQLLTLKGHSEAISSVAFSPDGQRIVTGSDDQTARVWEASGGRERFPPLKGHSAGIWSVAFSPDGQRILTGSFDQTAKVWDAGSGRELFTFKGHSGIIYAVAFSPVGQRIATGSDDETAKVWDAGSGKELLTLKGHGGAVRSVAFSPDGRRLATGSADHTAKVWEAATPQQVAAWQEEERAAEQHLTALQQQRTAEQERQRTARARDEGAIKRWLILAPIPLATNQSGAQGLALEQLEGEGRLQPKAGETRSLGNRQLKWQEVALEDYVIDFNAILGRMTEWSVAYAVCYIRSGAEQRGLQMLAGSDDGAKVYLNGKELHNAPGPRKFAADQDTVPDIALKAGLNVLVFKVVNETGGWLGCLRFTDAQGKPVKGIKVTLNPEAKD
jgi:WD40 repeat protein/serine/threonine protein kinase